MTPYVSATDKGFPNLHWRVWDPRHFCSKLHLLLGSACFIFILFYYKKFAEGKNAKTVLNIWVCIDKSKKKKMSKQIVSEIFLDWILRKITLNLYTSRLNSKAERWWWWWWGYIKLKSYLLRLLHWEMKSWPRDLIMGNSRRAAAMAILRGGWGWTLNYCKCFNFSTCLGIPVCLLSFP